MDEATTTRRLVLTVGLPRAGKSTWARAQGVPVVSPDAIRLALHGRRFIAEAEGMVWTVARLMVRSLFMAGHATVILDATSVTGKRRDEWKSREWGVNYRVFDTPSFCCQSRAANDGREDLLPVICRMAAEFEPLTAEEKRFEIEGGLAGSVPPVGGRPIVELIEVEG